MKPAWVRAVGVVGIVFAVAGFLNSAQTVATPWMLEMQTRMITEIAAHDPGKDPALVQALFPPQPPWFRAWSILAGLTGLVISGFYLYGCIRLLEARPGAAALFLGLSFAGLALALGRVVAAFQVGGAFLAVWLPAPLASAALHASLMAVVWSHARESPG